MTKIFAHLSSVPEFSVIKDTSGRVTAKVPDAVLQKTILAVELVTVVAPVTSTKDSLEWASTFEAK